MPNFYENTTIRYTLLKRAIGNTILQYTMYSVLHHARFSTKRTIPVAGRTEPSLSRRYRVSKLVRDYQENSLKNGNSKKKHQFERLTKAERREWRDALQRQIAAVKDRLASRVLTGMKLRGKTLYRWNKRTALEEQLIDMLDSSDEVEYQSGPIDKIVGVAGAGALATLGYAALQAGKASVKATDLLEKIQGDIGAAAEKSTNFLDVMKENIAQFVTKMSEVGGFFAKVVVAMLFVWLFSNFGHLPIIVSVLLSLVVTHIPEIKGRLESLLPNRLHFQSGNVSAVADLLSMACMLWIPGKSLSGTCTEFMKRASVFPRASEGIEAFMTKALQLIENFVNFVMMRNKENSITFTGQKDAFRSWKSEVIEMIKMLHTDATVPIETLRKCKDLMTVGYGFHQILVTEASKRELNFWIEKLSLKMQPHRGAMQAESNIRPMPYFMMFGGGTGVGKTSLMRFVASSVLMLAGEVKPSEALEQLWQKGTTQYWNGYVGQKCLVMDDCFQVRGKPGDMDSEAMQVIRAVGNWSYPLNFADLESKGRFYLDTPLMIGTTNCRNVSAEWASFITEPAALVRRFQGSYWVELTDEYKTQEGRFDFERVNDEFRSALQRIATRKAEGEKLTVDQVMDEMPWHVWNLKMHTFDRDNITDVNLAGGLRNAVEIAAREIKKRKEANKEQIQDLRDWTTALGDALDQDLELQIGNLRSWDPAGPGPSRLRAMAEAGVITLPETDSDDESEITVLEDMDPELQYVMNPAWPEDEDDEHDAVKSLWTRITEWVQSHPSLSYVTELFIAGTVGVVVGLAIALAITIVTAAVKVLWKVISILLQLVGIKPRPVEEQSNDGAFRSKKDKAMRITTFNEVEIQVGVPPDEHVHDHIYNNTLKCYTSEGILGQFLGIGADVFIFPKHFLKAIRKCSPDMKLHFVSAKHGVTGSITCRAFLERPIEEVPDFDVAGVSFGAVFMKASRSIVKYFLTQHELKQLLRGGNTGVRLDVATLQKDSTLRRQTYHSPTCEFIGTVAEGSGALLNGIVKYTASTQKGDCGAPLTVAENRYYGQRCVVGIHSAGRDNIVLREGYATTVTQEVARELKKRLQSFTETQEKIEEDIDVPQGALRVDMQAELDEIGLTTGSFELVGKLKERVNIATSTKLKPSAMNRDELFGPSPSAPAVLRPKVVGDEKLYPMVNGIKAYQTEVLCDSVEGLKPVVDVAMKPHWEATLKYPRDVLTFEEAIVPPEHWKMKPINRKTSAGYKYRKHVSPLFPGKTSFLGFEGDVDFNSPQLSVVRSDVEAICIAGEARERLVHLCTDFLKDELRPNAKVESVATRVISGTPFDYTIACRMYFGAYMHAMFSTHTVNGMAPGINHYTEWFMIASRLQNKKTKVFDGDFSRFDSSEQPWVHQGILEYINRWYKFNNPLWRVEDDNVRSTLWLDLVHSRHITGVGNTLDYVVQWNKSLPSGHPLTTVVNSMYSLITLTACYMKRFGGASDMWEHVYLCTFGDDNVNAVDDEVCDEFNQVTVAEDMKEIFNLTYTSGRKGADLVPYTTIDEVTFLKRTFLKDDDLEGGLVFNTPNLGWVAPLAKESFLYEGYWYKNARDPLTDLTTRIEHTVYELALHPSEMWEEYFPTLQAWCAENGVPMPVTSRAIARQEVKTRFDVWF